MRTSIRHRVASAAAAALGLTTLVLAGASAPAVTSPAQAATTIPTYDHVVLAIFENHEQSQIIGASNAPYLTSLAGQGANFTQSYAIEHPSQPNYLDLFSGSNQGVTDDSCPHTFSSDNVAHQLIAAGKTFKAYSEGLPSAGSTTCTNTATKYARKHNPWTDFSDLTQSSVNLPYTSFPTDFSTLPTYSWVVPNLCNDMHDCSVTTGDTWAKNNLDAYAQWAKTHNSLLILTFDEDDSAGTNQIATVFVGDHINAGSYNEHIDHYTVLRTLEDMYGVPALGGAASRTAITDVWNTGTSTGNTVTVTNPGSQTATVGSAKSLQIQASDSGSGQTLTYSATGLPAGLSIKSSTGLISGTPTTAGTFSSTVTAKDTTNASGSATFTWTVGNATGGCSGQLLGNPGFETGTATPWTASSGIVSNSTSEPAHTGSWDAWMDGYGSAHTDTLTQSVTIPAGCHASLSFWLHVDTKETTTSTAYDKLTVKAGSTTLATYSNLNKNTGYAQKTFDVSSLAGQTVTLSFSGVEDSSLATSFVADDAALTLS